MSPVVTIRSLEPGDRAQWEPLWIGYLTFYNQTLAPQVTQTTFERLIGDGAHSGVVAVRGGGLIGFAHYLLHNTTWAIGRTVYLEDLYVSEDARGAGVGADLIAAVKARAEAEGEGTLYWHTHRQNAVARRLYDRVGVLSDFVRYENK